MIMTYFITSTKPIRNTLQLNLAYCLAKDFLFTFEVNNNILKQNESLHKQIKLQQEELNSKIKGNLRKVVIRYSTIYLRMLLLNKAFIKFKLRHVGLVNKYNINIKKFKLNTREYEFEQRSKRATVLKELSVLDLQTIKFKTLQNNKTNKTNNLFHLNRFLNF